ncbi:MAG: tetratricopeptide repeat protein, partial [Planctomycetota bacterium]
LRLDPANRRAMLVMGRLLFLEGMAKEDNDILQEGRNYYEQALQMGAEDFQLFLDMAQLMGVEGDADGAKTFLEMAKAAFPRYVGPDNPYQLLAQLYQQEGNNDAALKEMEALARIVELQVDVRQQLAQYYLGRGDTQRGLQYLQEIENVTPLSSQLQSQLAQLLMREERYAEAATSYKVILGMADAGAQHDAARKSLVQALFSSEQFDEARDLCEQQLVARPGDAFWTQWLNKVKAAQGR